MRRWHKGGEIMYLKAKLMKASSVCSYVFTFLWFVLAACFFALGNNWCYGFAVFALIDLYNGFVITSIRENMTEVTLEKNEQTKFIVCWILSILCIPSFILNAIALFRKQEDEFVVVRQNIPAKTAPAPKNKVRFYRTKSFITMCVAFCLCFIASFSAMCFDTSGFFVKVTDFTLTSEMTKMYNNGEINGKKFVNDNDSTYAVTMYVPKTATEETPAPTVFVLPGFTRTKATMSQYAVELSRRGAVVFIIDPGAQGATTEPSTQGANGIEYLVQYVYNNTDDFKFCDKNRFGAIGHSAGGGNITSLAADMAGSSYEESVMKAIYISGYIKLSSINRYNSFNCNAAMSYGYYDEGAFRYQTDTESFETASLRFINEVSGKNNGYDTVAIDHGYGDISNGTYRIVHREDINHCFEMYDPISIANNIDFFDEALDMGSDIDAHSQTGFGKEFSNGIALAAAFTFVISLCAVLMNTPLFRSLKGKKDEAISEDEIKELTREEAAEEHTAAAADERMTASAKAKKPHGLAGELVKEHQTIAHKVIFWSSMILTAIIACLDYIPLANLSIEIFPTGNSASVYTYTFPARMVNAILLWAAINGAIGLVIFFGTTFIENLYEFIKFKVNGTEPVYDWDKFKAIKIGGNGKGAFGVLLNVLKALVLPLIMFGAFYLLVQLNYWMFHQDFRFMLISAAPLNARMFVTAIEYIPIIFVFYISNSIRVNCSIGREGWKEWKVLLVGALANSIGLGFILLINYVCYFTTGVPFYGYWGNGTEVWLYINMVFALVVMMFILPIFNRLLYKITGNVWTGAIACCMIFIMMTISASVSYIPI